MAEFNALGKNGAERMQRACDLGFEAARRGISYESNPFTALDERLAESWSEGHARGVGAGQIALKLARKPATHGVWRPRPGDDDLLYWPPLRASQAPQAPELEELEP